MTTKNIKTKLINPGPILQIIKELNRCQHIQEQWN